MLQPKQSGKPKLKIKSFKKKPAVPSGLLDSSWAKLRAAVASVHGRSASDSGSGGGIGGSGTQTGAAAAAGDLPSREQLYQLVQDLCTHKQGAELYRRLRAELCAHITATLAGLADASRDEGVFLQQVQQAWQDHCVSTLAIRGLFLYLDRTYVLQTAGTKQIWDLGLALFREQLVRRPEVQRRVVSGILVTVERERRGESVNRSLLRTLVRMFLALDLYEDALQPPFLNASLRFYQDEGRRLMVEYDTPTYLTHVDSRLAEEGHRIVHYLDEATKPPLMETVEEQLIAAHTQGILEKGFDALLDGQRHEDLKRLHRLFARVDATEQERTFFGNYIKGKGMEVVMDPQRDGDMVTLLLDFRARLQFVLENSFASHSRFNQAIKDAFEHFINARQNRPAELIAKFADANLRAGNKGGSEGDIESLLDRVMILFQFINGKDVFEAFYKKDLAKRLLLQRSASIDLEKSMISKLKTECGNAFTSKLEGMFKDMELSKDMMQSFLHGAQHRERELSKDVDMLVHVLTTGYWPAYPVAEVILPPNLAEGLQKFSAHYMSKHQGRRLCWQHSLGHCIVRTAFPKGAKELALSLFQTLVLILFERVDELGFGDIKTRTGIEDQELRRTLQSLACGKTRVLRKRPKGKDILDGDRFSFPLDFKHKLFRIKINTIQLKETEEENKGTHERVARDRQYQIDAAVVRIMKTRKQLTHALLMSELYNQLKFPAAPADLKRRIESLIDREYLERDEDEPGIYNYLA